MVFVAQVSFVFLALLHYICFVLLLMLTIMFCVDLFHKMQVFIILFYGVQICIAMTIFFILYVCFYFDCVSYLVVYTGFWFFWFAYCTSCFRNCFLASLLKMLTTGFHSLSFVVMDNMEHRWIFIIGCFIILLELLEVIIFLFSLVGF